MHTDTHLHTVKEEEEYEYVVVVVVAEDEKKNWNFGEFMCALRHHQRWCSKLSSNVWICLFNAHLSDGLSENRLA